MGQEEGDEGSGSEDLEEENVNLNGSEGVKKEKKYGCTQDLINDIDQLIGKAAQDDVTTGKECTAGAARDRESKSKVGKEPEVGGMYEIVVLASQKWMTLKKLTVKAQSQAHSQA